MRTRIEAFIDLMKTNRENNPKFQNKYHEPAIISEIYDKEPKSENNLVNFFSTLGKPLLDLFQLTDHSGAKKAPEPSH
jgi:hypothetical protein